MESTTETIIYADLDLDQIIATKLFADPLRHYSRPDLMWLTVDKRVKSMVHEDQERGFNPVPEDLGVIEQD